MGRWPARARLVAAVPAQGLDDGAAVRLAGRALVVAVAVDVHLAGGARHLQARARWRCNQSRCMPRHMRNAQAPGAANAKQGM